MGGGGNNFVPVSGGEGTKIVPLGDLFEQPPSEMNLSSGKLADHAGDHVVLSPERVVFVPSPGAKSLYPCPPPPPICWNTLTSFYARNNSFTRSYTSILEDFVILAGQVHKADTGCGGPLSTDGPGTERSDEVGMKCVCLGCGANFGRLSIGGTDSVATVLGVLLAGSTHGALSATCAYADRATMTRQTFHKTQKKILRVIDSSFEEFLSKSRTALHGEASRKILVPKDSVFFLEHEQELYNLIDTSFGLEVRPELGGKHV